MGKGTSFISLTLLSPPVNTLLYVTSAVYLLCSCFQAAQSCWKTMQSWPVKNSWVQLPLGLHPFSVITQILLFHAPRLPFYISEFRPFPLPFNGLNGGPPKDMHSSSPRVCEFYLIWEESIIKLRVLRWDCLGLSGWAGNPMTSETEGDLTNTEKKALGRQKQGLE